MILNPVDVARASDLVEAITGERLAPGDTGWLQVLVRALDLGATYRRLWEHKHHGQVDGVAPARDGKVPLDEGG